MNLATSDICEPDCVALSSLASLPYRIKCINKAPQIAISRHNLPQVFCALRNFAFSTARKRAFTRYILCRLRLSRWRCSSLRFSDSSRFLTIWRLASLDSRRNSLAARRLRAAAKSRCACRSKDLKRSRRSACRFSASFPSRMCGGVRGFTISIPNERQGRKSASFLD